MRRRMRTSIQYRFGGPEVLELVEADVPVPHRDEVLVRMAAASINHGETKVRRGEAPAGPLPFTLGSDLSGVVEQVGGEVTRFKAGDEVYGIKFIGTYADYIAVPEHGLAIKPPELDHVHAAALPVAALTAWQAIEEHAAPRPGQRVLVHAAAGGVGHLAVQYARHRGACVLATARAAKHGFLRELGADDPIDYTAVDFTSAARDVDAVLDLVGGEYGKRSLESLRPGGILITAALNPGVSAEETRARGRRYARVAVRPLGSDLEKVSCAVREGWLRVHVERTFPMEGIPAAHELSEVGGVTGKLVIVP